MQGVSWCVSLYDTRRASWEWLQKANGERNWESIQLLLFAISATVRFINWHSSNPRLEISFFFFFVKHKWKWCWAEKCTHASTSAGAKEQK